MTATLPSQVPTSTKRKEIYKYDAPWTLYNLSWSVRPDKKFRLALGSFVEEYNNKVKLLFEVYIREQPYYYYKFSLKC